MTGLVADTSALVSLGVAADDDPDPLAVTLDAYEVRVPRTVADELEDVAAYDDVHGEAAEAVLSRTGDLTVSAASLDESFPLDDGENAAVQLANDDGAELVLCDEFEQIGLVHASLADARLLTTPTLLSVLVRCDRLPRADARDALDAIADASSWSSNSYVSRARQLLTED